MSKGNLFGSVSGLATMRPKSWLGLAAGSALHLTRFTAVETRSAVRRFVLLGYERYGCLPTQPITTFSLAASQSK